MSVPSFMLPTNFRMRKNIKRLIKEFDVQGYGIAVYLLETLAETDNHMYPYQDIDLLADEMRVSSQKIETVILKYQIFELINTQDGDMFISCNLNKWLEPYYLMKEQRQIAGRISAAKRRKKQIEQLNQLSQLDSSQRPLNDRSTINKLINKLINEDYIQKEAEKYEKLNEYLLSSQINKDKKRINEENLAQASKDNQVPI